MKRNSVIILVVSLMSMFTGFALFQFAGSRLAPPEIQSAQPGPAKSNTSQSLESIPLITLQGQTQILGDLPQTVLVVNFWAPWCVPCRREIPDLIALQREYGDRIQVLGVALDSVENIEAFASEYQMNYPSFVANQHIAMYNSVFKNTSGALPFTAIIDRDRKIDYTHTGIIELQTLRKRVSKLL